MLVADDPTVQTMLAPLGSSTYVDGVKIHRTTDFTAAEARRNRRPKHRPYHLQWLTAALIWWGYEFLDKSLRRNVELSNEESAKKAVPHLWRVDRKQRGCTR